MKINNCLGCDEVEINFSKADNVHIIIYSLVTDMAKDLPAVTPVAQAILLLCSLTYPDSDSLETIPQLKIGKGSVSMSFKVYPVNKENETEPESESDLDEEPSTSKQALERMVQRAERKAKEASTRNVHSKGIYVNVERRFDMYFALDTVSYYINGGKRQSCPLPEFHAKFFVRPQHSINLLRQLHEKCSGNWLKVIQSDGDGDAFKKFK